MLKYKIPQIVTLTPDFDVKLSIQPPNRATKKELHFTVTP